MTHAEVVDALAQSPNRCPFCQAKHLLNVDNHYGRLFPTIHCITCHAQWREVHIISMIREIYEPLKPDPNLVKDNSPCLCDECGYSIKAEMEN